MRDFDRAALSIGGLLMGLICRVTDWPRQAAYSFVLAPVLLGAIPFSNDQAKGVATVERMMAIDALPDAIWKQIHNANDIRPDEINHGWMYRIGVPLPISGVTERTPNGLERKITMGKGIQFKQVVTDWTENRFVRWKYRFTDQSFPAGALDDHVRIGGKYFDLIDTSYSLVPLNERTTQLTISMTYRVSTDFNWYADPIARLLIGNFEDVILDFYRNRAVKAAQSL
jgi:hypothetical protein